MNDLKLFIMRFSFAFSAYFSWDIVSGNGIGAVEGYYRFALLCALTIQVYCHFKNKKTRSADR